MSPLHGASHDAPLIPRHTPARPAMEHTTPTADIEALLAEVDALLLEGAATDARVEAP